MLTFYFTWDPVLGLASKLGGRRDTAVPTIAQKEQILGKIESPLPFANRLRAVAERSRYI